MIEGPKEINEMSKDYYYFSALDLKEKTFNKDVNIKEGYVEVRLQFFYSARRPFRKIAMLKSINH